MTKHKIRIWDLPTRLFHWLLVIAFIVAMLSQGDDRYLDIHVLSGYLFLVLLSFRLIWGKLQCLKISYYLIVCWTILYYKYLIVLVFFILV